jgi:hypothetical protein
MNLVWRFLAEPQIRAAFRESRFGYRLRPKGLLEIATDDLRARKEPLRIPKSRADLSRIYQGAEFWKAENPIERFFPLVNGVQDRRFCRLPHVELLRDHERGEALSLECDYARLLFVRARLQGRRRTADFVRGKMERLVTVYDSIKRDGYMKGRYWRYPILVSSRPIHPPTPGYEPRNFEVIDGHHRAAAVTCLGTERVRVLVAEPIQVAPFDWSYDIAWREEFWTERHPAPLENIECDDAPGG